MNIHQENFTENDKKQNALSLGKKIYGIIMIVLSTITLIYAVVVFAVFIDVEISVNAGENFAGLGFVIGLMLWIYSLIFNLIVFLVNLFTFKKNTLVRIALFISLGAIFVGVVTILFFVVVSQGR